MEHEHTYHATAHRHRGQYRPQRPPARGARRRGGWSRRDRRDRRDARPTAWQERIERWVMEDARDHTWDPDR